MIQAFYSGISGLRAHQEAINVTSDNLANIQSVGYRGYESEFASLFDNAKNSVSLPGSVDSTVGVGTRVQATTMNISQGSLVNSERNTDLAIVGDGWFAIEDANERYFTRAGSFTFDENKVTEEELIAKINEGHYKVVIENTPAFAFEGVVPACPVCGNKGQLVPNTVFNSNVGKQAREKINTEKDNYICMDADCDVAYYNAENDTVVSKSELKRELWYKTGTEKVIACYCNNIDTDMIKEAVVNHGLTSWDDIVGHYRTKVIEKCETLNPSGYCCRSTFDGMVKKIQEEL